jgi:hypothetical protein
MVGAHDHQALLDEWYHEGRGLVVAGDVLEEKYDHLGLDDSGKVRAVGTHAGARGSGLVSPGA